MMGSVGEEVVEEEMRRGRGDQGMSSDGELALIGYPDEKARAL
jgi:hypothetical protein